MSDRDALQRAYNAICSAQASLREVTDRSVGLIEDDLERVRIDLAPLAFPKGDARG